MMGSKANKFLLHYKVLSIDMWNFQIFSDVTCQCCILDWSMVWPITLNWRNDSLAKLWASLRKTPLSSMRLEWLPSRMESKWSRLQSCISSLWVGPWPLDLHWLDLLLCGILISDVLFYEAGINSKVGILFLESLQTLSHALVLF